MLHISHLLNNKSAKFDVCKRQRDLEQVISVRPLWARKYFFVEITQVNSQSRSLRLRIPLQLVFVLTNQGSGGVGVEGEQPPHSA
jgi:hypothetical protein